MRLLCLRARESLELACKESVNERWKTYPGDYRFSVSTLGRVQFEDKLPKQIKPRQSGYTYVCTTLNKKKVQYAVHIMVLETFIGFRPLGCTASHLDGNPLNNNAANLIWETHSGNCARKKDHGTSQAGEKNGWAKLTFLDVDCIRKSKLSFRQIAPIYGVADAHVRKIRAGGAW